MSKIFSALLFVVTVVVHGLPLEEEDDVPSPIPGMFVTEMNALLDAYTADINSLCPGSMPPAQCECEFGLRLVFPYFLTHVSLLSLEFLS